MCALGLARPGLRAVRLDHLASELSRSDAPIGEICLSCGWPHAAHAMRLFKRRFGKTMGDWREQGMSGGKAPRCTIPKI